SLLRLELQTVLTCSFCQRFNASVIEIASAVKYYSFYIFIFSTFCYECAYFSSSIYVRAVFTFEIRVSCRSTCKCNLLAVINHLCIYVLVGTVDVQTWSFGCAGKLVTHSLMSFLTHFVLVNFSDH